MRPYLALFIEIIGVISVVQIMAVSPVLAQRKPVKFANPARESTLAVNLAVLLVVLTAVISYFFPTLLKDTLSFLPFSTELKLTGPAEMNSSGLVTQLGLMALMAAPFLVSMLSRKQPWLSAGLKQQMYKGGLQLGLVLILVVIFLRGLVYHLIQGPYTISVLWLLLACLVTAFVEEFIFRGYIQLRLMDRWGSQIGWLATAGLCALWGIIPLLNAPLMIILISAGYRFGLALLLGWVARQSGGILGGWLYHAAHLLLFWL